MHFFRTGRVRSQLSGFECAATQTIDKSPEHVTRESINCLSAS